MCLRSFEFGVGRVCRLTPFLLVMGELVMTLAHPLFCSGRGSRILGVCVVGALVSGVGVVGLRRTFYCEGLTWCLGRG